MTKSFKRDRINVFNKVGTGAEWVRASILLHSEWMVPSLNPCEGKMFFEDGELRVIGIDGFVTSNK